MSRAHAMCTALRMPIKKPLGEGDFAGALWGAHLDGNSGKLGFPMCPRAALSLTTCLGVLVGVNKVQLKRLLGVWGSLSRFGGSASPSSTSVSLLPRASLAASLAHSLEISWTCWSLSLCSHLYSITASSRTLRLRRLKGSVGPQSAKISGAHCTTCPKSAANTCAWTGDFSHLTPHIQTLVRRRPGTLCLCLGDPSSRSRSRHTNLLEIESGLSLLRHLVSEGRRNCRILALPESRVALGALSKGRSSSRRVNSSTLCGYQPGSTRLKLSPEKSPSRAGARHFRSCRRCLRPGCCLHMPKQSFASFQPFATDSRRSLPQGSPLASTCASNPRAWPEPRHVQPVLSLRVPTFSPTPVPSYVTPAPFADWISPASALSCDAPAPIIEYRSNAPNVPSAAPAHDG